MANRIFLYSYNFTSEGAKTLAAALGIKRIRHEHSKYSYKNGDVVINWGGSKLPPEVAKAKIINAQDAISLCTNKLHFFQNFSGIEGVNIPNFTTDKDKVSEWLKEKRVVFARTKLNGMGGKGIVEMEGPDCEIEDAQLYVEYIPKKEEYRIHVVNGEIISEQRKGAKIRFNQRIDPDDLPIDAPEPINWRIRNLENGFVFVRNDDKEVPNCVKEQALNIFVKTGLDFFAADIIYNAHREKAYILELNTAPGLQGTTLEDYTTAFKKMIGAM